MRNQLDEKVQTNCTVFVKRGVSTWHIHTKRKCNLLQVSWKAAKTDWQLKKSIMSTSLSLFCCSSSETNTKRLKISCFKIKNLMRRDFCVWSIFYELRRTSLIPYGKSLCCNRSSSKTIQKDFRTIQEQYMLSFCDCCRVCLPGALYTSLRRFSLSVGGAPLGMLWVQLWQMASSKSVWALVACTVKWGSSKIHSVVGTHNLLLLKKRDKRQTEHKKCISIGHIIRSIRKRTEKWIMLSINVMDKMPNHKIIFCEQITISTKI